MQDFIRIHEKDNVVVALRDIPPGMKLDILTERDAPESASGQKGILKRKNALRQGGSLGEEAEDSWPSCGRISVTVREVIPAGHKMAICDIPAGGEVIKYGYRIGNAVEDIKAGDWIHTHNLKTALGDLLEYSYEPVFGEAKDKERMEETESIEETESGRIPEGAGKNECGEKAKSGSGFIRGEEETWNGLAEKGEGQSIGKNPTEVASNKVKLIEKESASELSFMGYRRPDGKVGIRNEIWIIPTVGCVNNVASAIAKKANEWLSATPNGPRSLRADAASNPTVNLEAGKRQSGEAADMEPKPDQPEEATDMQLKKDQPEEATVEEVIAFPHPYGCSQMGEDQEHTRTILADLIGHPNAGGVLVLGLGCENSNIQVLKPYLGDYDENRVKFLVSQECEDEVAEGLEIVKSLIEQASSFHREPISVSELVIGLKCGGSDGLSGITANPLVGRFSDRLVSQGGTTILTEVPEMFGAETILMNRCANEELFRQTVDLINDFKSYFKSHGQTIYENPSPGNKKGGISTLEDKSLGCTQKSGSALVRGVLQYGEKVRARGLNLLSAPGNDLVASTALAAAGAHMVLFTTGRGTPFASPVPTVKISTNSALAERKSKWIDFNAGILAEEGQMDRETDRLFRYVVEVASGRKVCSEEEGYHDMAIFKQGVTL